MTGKVCAPKRRPKKATEREATTFIWDRLIGLRGCLSGSATSASVLIPTVRVETRQDAVFHGATQPVDLRRGGSTHFDVLDANAVEILASGRVPDAEALRRKLEGKPRGVEVQDLTLASPELRLREGAVGVDRCRPFEVVEHVTPRDGGKRRHDGLGRR